jgi:tRNA U34 5-methylaminomethyl-2-thiouridine-forming methyltransferase MnmC
MVPPELYRMVRLPNGTHSVRSLAEAETFHPVVGPQAEAEALYVRQLRLVERLEAKPGEFVIWDVGLGAAANPLTFLQAARNVPGRVRVISFDHKAEPLAFALTNLQHLPYLAGFETPCRELLEKSETRFQTGALSVEWQFILGDFPAFLKLPAAAALPKPHAIMFDAFSPATNPAMWTLPLFTDLFRLLDPQRPCGLPTYSRSTILRVTLLLAGFFVGVGHPTGEKEETTLAANTLELLEEPLPRKWLERVKRSSSAEPMLEPVYRQAPLSPAHWEKLAIHPQFRY